MPALKAETPLASNKSIIKSLNINSIIELSTVIKLRNDTENIKMETLYFFSNKQTHKIHSKNVLRLVGRNISDPCGGRI
jgi:hypothetical protein